MQLGSTGRTWELPGFVPVVITRPALEHCMSKSLPVFVTNTQAWCPDNVHVQWKICIHNDCELCEPVLYLNDLELAGFSLYL